MLRPNFLPSLILTLSLISSSITSLRDAFCGPDRLCSLIRCSISLLVIGSPLTMTGDALRAREQCAAEPEGEQRDSARHNRPS